MSSLRLDLRALLDRLRGSPLACEARALSRAARSLGSPSTERKLGLLVAALGWSRSPLLRRALERRLRPAATGPAASIWRERRVGWQRYRARLGSPALLKSIVLKAPGEDEKGVLYIAFETSWLRLVEHHDLEAILREYVLVVAPSSSPPHFGALFALAGAGTGPVFVQQSNPADAAALAAFAPTFAPLPIMACDWIDPGVYRPKPHSEREIDVVMVAGWMRQKGHRLLFRALRRMDPSLRVLLVGQDMEGQTADDVWREARAYGVAGRIELVRDAEPEAVAGHLSNSRALALLSRREGSAVVMTEALFADTPVLMLGGAHVGARAYLNASTGVLSRPHRLHRDLGRLVADSAAYAPRAWALDRITCFQTTDRLNAILRDDARGRGQAWTRDIVPMRWRPDPEYVLRQDRDALGGAYRGLAEQHGVRFRDHPVREAA